MTLNHPDWCFPQSVWWNEPCQSVNSDHERRRRLIDGHWSSSGLFFLMKSRQSRSSCCIFQLWERMSFILSNTDSSEWSLKTLREDRVSVKLWVKDCGWRSLSFCIFSCLSCFYLCLDVENTLLLRCEGKKTLKTWVKSSLGSWYSAQILIYKQKIN